MFAAASLTEAFEEIGQQFAARYPGNHVSFNFAGSQQLAQQLAQGAPADVFAAANQRQMTAVRAAGRVASGAEQDFVHNRLVVITPQDNPAGIDVLQDLAKPRIKLVLAAREAPVGAYSLDFLRKAALSPAFTDVFSQTVLANVVSYEENVKAVVSKVALGEADAGIVYASDVSPGLASQLAHINIPAALNVAAAYPIAPIADAANPALARLFVDYVLSADGQATLARFGFIPIETVP